MDFVRNKPLLVICSFVSVAKSVLYNLQQYYVWILVSDAKSISKYSRAVLLFTSVKLGLRLQISN